MPFFLLCCIHHTFIAQAPDTSTPEEVKDATSKLVVELEKALKCTEKLFAKAFDNIDCSTSGKKLENTLQELCISTTYNLLWNSSMRSMTSFTLLKNCSSVFKCNVHVSSRLLS